VKSKIYGLVNIVVHNNMMHKICYGRGWGDCFLEGLLMVWCVSVLVLMLLAVSHGCATLIQLTVAWVMLVIVTSEAIYMYSTPWNPW